MPTPLFLPTARTAPQGVERSELPPLLGTAPADLSGDGPARRAFDFRVTPGRGDQGSGSESLGSLKRVGLDAEVRRLGFEALYAHISSHGKA